MDRIPVVDETWTAKDGSGETFTVKFVADTWCAGLRSDGAPRVVTIVFLNRAFAPPDPLADLVPRRVWLNLYPKDSPATTAQRTRVFLTREQADTNALADRLAVVRFVVDGVFPVEPVAP